MQYRREIDGLRAIAVLSVILFHAGFILFKGGYVGVDVFFVISGYLITGLLMADLEAGTFSILRFYERRARRILPALFVVLLAFVPFAYLWMLPAQLTDFAQGLIAVELFASNILFMLKSGYFTAPAALNPLLHTWSLAVEEQFYLIFPLFLALVWPMGRRRVFWLLAGLTVISLAAAEWGWRHQPNANFYLALTRAWELLFGALSAVLTRTRGQRSSNLLSLIGLGLILSSVVLYGSMIPFPSLLTLAPVLGATLILHYGPQGTWVAWLLSRRPLVGMGLISYSAYLWHQPIFAFAHLYRSKILGPLLAVALVIVALALAYLTWRFVEQPFRKGPKPIFAPRKQLFAASGGMGAVIIALGLYGQSSDGLAWRFAGLPDFVRQGQLALPSLSNGHCFYSFNDVSALPIGTPGVKCLLAEGGSTRVLLFGDSFAAQWEPFWKPLGRDWALSINAITTNYCFPAFSAHFIGPKASPAYPQCQFNRSFVQDHLDDYDVIILAGMWELVEEQGFGPDVLAAVDDILRQSRARIVIMDSPLPVPPRAVEDFIFRKIGPLTVVEPRFAPIKRFEAALHDRFKASDRVRFLSREMLFGNYRESAGLLTPQGQPYSLDGAHISIYGALQAYAGFKTSAAAQDLVDFMTGH